MCNVKPRKVFDHRVIDPQFFCWLMKNALEPTGSGAISASPGFHPIGHTRSGCFWTCTMAWSTRSVSSTLRIHFTHTHTRVRTQRDEIAITLSNSASRVSVSGTYTRCVYQYASALAVRNEYNAIINDTNLRPNARLLIVEC